MAVVFDSLILLFMLKIFRVTYFVPLFSIYFGIEYSMCTNIEREKSNPSNRLFYLDFFVRSVSTCR